MLVFTAGVKGDTALGTKRGNPATSCNQIYQLNPTSRGTIGQYFVKIDDVVQTVTCNMKLNVVGLKEDGCKLLIKVTYTMHIVYGDL